MPCFSFNNNDYPVHSTQGDDVSAEAGNRTGGMF